MMSEPFWAIWPQKHQNQTIQIRVEDKSVTSNLWTFNPLDPFFSHFFLGGRLTSHYIWGSIQNAWRKPREIHLVLAQGLNNLRSTDVCQRQLMCVKAGEAFLEEIWDPFENLDPGILYLTRILGALHKRCPIWRCQKARITNIDPWRCFPFSTTLASFVCHWMGKVILPQRVLPSLVWMITLWIYIIHIYIWNIHIYIWIYLYNVYRYMY